MKQYPRPETASMNTHQFYSGIYFILISFWQWLLSFIFIKKTIFRRGKTSLMLNYIPLYYTIFFLRVLYRH